MDGWMDSWMNGWMEVWMDVRMDGLMYGWVDVCMDRWMDTLSIIICLNLEKSNFPNCKFGPFAMQKSLTVCSF